MDIDGLARRPSKTRSSRVDPPLIPARSPLRPPPRPAAEDPANIQQQSLPSLATLLSAQPAYSTAKDLPPPPDSPMSTSDYRRSTGDSSITLADSPSSSKHSSTGSATSTGIPTKVPMTKRQHALHELLSSERAYASDLALIRDIHIPLALGLTVPLTNVPTSPPHSSGSSSRTLSTSSDSSTASLGPPMSAEDTKIIFGNITELALFADMFSEELEIALGSVVDGGLGEDCVGELFLKIAPEMERPYKQYITRHPTALQHLSSLPSTPALQNYLTYTQTVASSLSHAWDLSSLLIKPVQRLLKYPLLLAAILDETPDGHGDKENLRAARTRMEEVARNVNEGRRRAEVVKDVLGAASVGGNNKAGAGGKGKKMGVGVVVNVNLSKMKSLKYGGVTAATMRVAALEGGAAGADGGADGLLGDAGVGGGGGGGGVQPGSSEAAQVEALQNELRRLDTFSQTFAKTIVDWGKMTSNMMLALRTWAHAFGKVIGLSAEQGSEAFDAFMEVVQRGLMPLAADMEAAINERVLKDLAHLLTTMTQPMKLISSMNEQEPYHYHLLTMPVSARNRPPPSLLAASTNYLALRGQLAAELPTYIELFQRGLGVLVRRLAGLQMTFWKDVRERWVELWEMLRVEGEANAGWEETVGVWMARWVDVEECLGTLGIGRAVGDLVGRVVREREEREERAVRERVLRDKEERERRERERERILGGMMGGLGFGGGVPLPPSVSSPTRQHERRNSKSSGLTGFSNGSGSGSGSGGGPSIASASVLSVASSQKAAAVQSMFAALDPANVHHLQRDVGMPAPQPVGAAQMYGHAGARGDGARRGRTRGSSDVSANANAHVQRRPASNESLRDARRRDRDREQMGLVHQASLATMTSNNVAPRDAVKARRKTHGYASGSGAGVGTGYGAMADDYAEYLSSAYHQQGHPYAQVQQAQAQVVPGGMPGYEFGTIPRPGLPRTQSMPLSVSDSSSVGTTSTLVPSRVRDFEGEVGRDAAGLEEDEWYEEYLVDRYARGYAGQAQAQVPPMSPPPQQELRRSGSMKQREVGPQQQQELRRSGSMKQREGAGTAQNTVVKERGRRGSAPRSPVAVQITTTTISMRDASPRPRVSQSRENGRDTARDNGRERERDSKERTSPAQSRKRSGSVKSITSFFTGSTTTTTTTTSASGPDSQPQPLSTSQRDSWVSKPAKYICQAIHPCKPPASVSYYSFPFFTLAEGELYEVLQEAGHPSIHPKLPLYVDDGEDCLLLCRDGHGVVGWALASFLEPVSVGGPAGG